MVRENGAEEEEMGKPIKSRLKLSGGEVMEHRTKTGAEEGRARSVLTDIFEVETQILTHKLRKMEVLRFLCWIFVIIR